MFMKQSNRKEKKIFLVEIAVVVTIILCVITLTWKLSSKKRYTITFDSMGGTYTTSTRVLSNKKIKEPVHPTKKGYIFVGWYYDNIEFNFDEQVTSDMNLVAHWEKQEKETFSIEKIIKGIQNGQAIIAKKMSKSVEASVYE